MTSVAEYELKAEMIRDITQRTLEKTIPIEVEGYCCDGEMLVDVLIKAASENSSVEAACQDLSEVADSNTLREHLNEQFDVSELWQQEAQINQAFACHISQMRCREGA